MSLLKVGNLEEIKAQHQPQLTEKSYLERSDRKMGYRLPPCDDASGFNISLQEPKLHMLGVGSKKNGIVRAFVNGQEIPMEESMRIRFTFGMVYVNRWVWIEDIYNQTRPESYALSLCSPNGAWLRQVVGIMKDHSQEAVASSAQ